MIANTSKKILNTSPFNKYNILVLILISVIFSILIIYLAHNIANRKLIRQKKISPEILIELNNLEQEASLLNNTLTVNNSSIEGLATNAALIEQQQQVLNRIIQLKPFIIQSKKFKLIDLAAQLIEANTLYHLKVNSDYIYAYKNAHTAKYLIEEQIKNSQYLTNQNVEDLYYKLKNIYPNFPRTYARVIYTLGRIYFYNMDRNKLAYSTKLLKLSNALTRVIERNTGIATLEAVLTEQNGLLRLLVDSNEIPKMQEAIDRYKYYLDDETIYWDKSKKIVMKYCNLSQSELNTKIANIYLKIANLISDSHLKRENYNKALIHMIGGSYDDESYKGTFNFVDASSTRKDFYFVTLGDILSFYPNENVYEKVKGIFSKYNATNPIKNKGLS